MPLHSAASTSSTIAGPSRREIPTSTFSRPVSAHVVSSKGCNRGENTHANRARWALLNS